ncbi:MAG: hypothetical protein EBX40_07735 [Gammaproteobacteria bacterium]|nr:hypothetical protein [Gammaproteobacteria bacterium]
MKGCSIQKVMLAGASILFAMLVSACMSDELKTPLPEEKHIGVISLLGPENLVDIDQSKTQHTDADQLAEADQLNRKLTDQLVASLKTHGYAHVEPIYVHANQNPAQVIRDQKGLDAVVVISSDAAHAPVPNHANVKNDLLFGYGAYFDDHNQNNPKTFSYASYDISVYDPRDLSIKATSCHSLTNKLPSADWAPSEDRLNPATRDAMHGWEEKCLFPRINNQTLEMLHL